MNFSFGFGILKPNFIDLVADLKICLNFHSFIIDFWLVFDYNLLCEI